VRVRSISDTNSAMVDEPLHVRYAMSVYHSIGQVEQDVRRCRGTRAGTTSSGMKSPTLAGRGTPARLSLENEFRYLSSHMDRGVQDVGLGRIDQTQFEVRLGDLLGHASGSTEEHLVGDAFGLGGVDRQAEGGGRYRRCCLGLGQTFCRRTEPVGRGCRWRRSPGPATTLYASSAVHSEREVGLE